MKITKSQLKELIMKEMQESSFMDKVDKEKSAFKARFSKEFKRTKPDASPEEVEEIAALAARAVPMVARAIGTDAAIDKVTGEDEELDEIGDEIGHIAGKLSPITVAKSARKAAGIEDDEEVEEGKFKAVKKVGKKVYDKVAPHVKDIAKDAAARAIEKGAEKAKDAVAKKLGSKQKDEGGPGSGRPTKPGSKRDVEKRMDKAVSDANAKLDAAEKAMKAKKKKKKKKAKEEGSYYTRVHISPNTPSVKTTYREIKEWMKKLEENRYKKTYINDARRVAWFVNNNLSEDYESMPARLRRKTEGAKYSRERYLAKEFIKHLESKQVNEAKLRESIRNIIKRLI